MTTEFGSPIEILRPARRSVPMILSSPHSGQIYPPCLLQKTRLHLNQLRRLEDAFVDRLFDMAPAIGAPFLRARFARAFIDPNREASEFDPDLLDEPLPPHANGDSAKARAGLGTVPSRLAGQPIYRSRLSLGDVERRVRVAYWPYHHALQRLIDEGQSRFGEVLLLDCHSMPSFTASGALSRDGAGGGMIDIALGDRFGNSCSPAIVRRAEAFLQGEGLRVTRNRPYAGGHITAHYGQPHLGVHALQIEVRRGLYMDESRLRPLDTLDALKGVMRKLLLALAELMSDSVLPASAKALPAE
ncbi:MAG: N-formylglutamate amidohydrolase [Alphaproteobacteria bacterium]